MIIFTVGTFNSFLMSLSKLLTIMVNLKSTMEPVERGREADGLVGRHQGWLMIKIPPRRSSAFAELKSLWVPMGS